MGLLEGIFNVEKQIEEIKAENVEIKKRLDALEATVTEPAKTPAKAAPVTPPAAEKTVATPAKP